MVRNEKSIWDAIRSTLVHLHPTSVIELGRMSKAPVSVRVMLMKLKLNSSMKTYKTF